MLNTFRVAALASFAALLGGCVSLDATGPTAEAARYEAMRKYVGEWDELVTWKRSDVDKPIRWQGHSSNDMLGRLWMVGRHTANFLGMRYEASEILGFDDIEGQWIAIWIDRLTDHHLVLRGSRTDTATLSLAGSIRSRQTGAMVPFKRIDRWIDADTLEVKWQRPSADGQVQEEFTVLQHRVR